MPLGTAVECDVFSAKEGRTYLSAIYPTPYLTEAGDAVYLHVTRDVTMMNTYASMEKIARELGQDRGVVFEYECFDIGHLYTLKILADRGWVKPPFFIQSVFGFVGGIGTDARHVLHFKETA